jgi:CelD/BcsL family acetyltransferase involved in cellulose biosynthesis
MSADAIAAPVALPFRVGARTLGSVTRRLVRLSVPLEEAMAGTAPALPGLPPTADGYFIRALPEALLPQMGGGSGMRAFVRQRYPRHFARLDQSFDDYLAGFSSKSRSSLKRKRRRLEERSGGVLDIRTYRRAEEMDAFYAGARAVSALTYQEKLLEAGLPEGALEEMRDLAERDSVRAWLLFLDGRPISYLYAPARGDCLLYAYLGYDPAAADLSPGTVLQLEAMGMLTQEGRFRWFDFTEGDGQHKKQFATGSVPSVDLLLLRPTASNRTAMAALNAFDASVALGKGVASRFGLGKLARSLRR